MAELRRILYEGLREAMGKDRRIVSISADLAKANGLLALEQEFPGRAFNVGIAEASMVCIAAGMASRGMLPVINTFCAFATRRVVDQIAVSVCYAGQNVKIIGTDPGICAELNGGTHMAFEDVGAVRSIPGLMVLEPCDGIEAEEMIRAMLAYEGPAYMRMQRKEAEPVHRPDYRFQWGRADRLLEGRDVTVICGGICAADALRAAAALKERGISAEVINLHTIKPPDKEAIVSSARKTGAVVTVENHNVIGSIGSAVAEVLSACYPVRLRRLGPQDAFGEVGRIPYLKQRFGMTEAHIAAACEEMVGNK